MADACEELIKFTLLAREPADYLVDRYRERRKREPEHLKAVAADLGFLTRYS